MSLSSPFSPGRRLRAPDPTGVAARLRSTGMSVRTLIEGFREGQRRRTEPRAVAAPPGSLTVASWNLHKCVGTDGRFDPARSVQVIAELGAELVALQEADKRFGRRTGLLDLHALERATGLVPLRVSDLADGHGWHGNAVLVRPGTRARFRRLALPGAEPRGALVAELDLPQGHLRVVAAHFGLLRRCRTRQAEAILKALAEGEQMPTLLLGGPQRMAAGPPFRAARAGAGLRPGAAEPAELPRAPAGAAARSHPRLAAGARDGCRGA